jgi:hypothetical protein
MTAVLVRIFARVQRRRAPNGRLSGDGRVMAGPAAAAGAVGEVLGQLGEVPARDAAPDLGSYPIATPQYSSTTLYQFSYHTQ